MSNFYDTDTGLQAIIKQPWEDILLDMDLSERMRAGDSIALVNSVSIINQGKVSGSGDITQSGSAFNGAIAQTRIAAGHDGENYKITFRCTTAAGDKIEGDGIVKVRD